VYTPTLTGLADRSHLMSAEVDLDGVVQIPGRVAEVAL
jgi:hypothetical protein